MIKVFRKFRQKLIPGNRVGKYLLYAIGEIVLVVIGILIALQANNWNEDRLEKRREVEIAQDIQKELEENLSYLKSIRNRWESRQEHLQALYDTLAFKNLKISQMEFDSLLVGSMSFGSFDLIDGRLQRILTLEGFNFRRSDTLLLQLVNLARLYKSIHEYYQYNVDTYKNIVQPYIIETYSFRNLTAVFRNNQKRNFAGINHEKLLVDPVFDNIIENMRGDVDPVVGLLTRCIKEIEKLMKDIYKIYPEISNNNMIEE